MVVIIVDGTICASGTVPDVRRSLGRHTVAVSIERPLFPLAEAFAGFDIAEASTREVHLNIPDESVLDDVLAAARRAGSIDTSRFEPPTLTEVFGVLAGAGADRPEPATASGVQR